MKQAACRAVSRPARSRVRFSTWPGSWTLTPSTGRPAAMRRIRPATLTMKNSSRLLAKIARNRTRSSSGTLSSSASSSTRWLNRSQLSSRSRYRFAGSGGRSLGKVLTAAVLTAGPPLVPGVPLVPACRWSRRRRWSAALAGAGPGGRLPGPGWPFWPAFLRSCVSGLGVPRPGALGLGVFRLRVLGLGTALAGHRDGRDALRRIAARGYWRHLVTYLVGCGRFPGHAHRAGLNAAEKARLAVVHAPIVTGM